jgi:hypothetical protein
MLERVPAKPPVHRDVGEPSRFARFQSGTLRLLGRRRASRHILLTPELLQLLTSCIRRPCCQQGTKSFATSSIVEKVAATCGVNRDRPKERVRKTVRRGVPPFGVASPFVGLGVPFLSEPGLDPYGFFAWR